MIFEALYQSAIKGELLLIDGGFCHWHLRKDGQLTISEIIATKKGAGSKMLDIIKKKNKAKASFILAKCPTDLSSNKWWEKRGFKKIRVEDLKSGRKNNVWVLSLEKEGGFEI